MPLAPNDIRRIQSPSWADVALSRADVDFDPATLSAIHDANELLLDVIHSAVVDYLTDPQLCFDDDNFPSTVALTGEYYVSCTSHIWHAGVRAFHVATSCNCLGASPGPRSPDDYLGLEVHLQWLPESRSFISWRNTDSSVI